MLLLSSIKENKFTHGIVWLLKRAIVFYVILFLLSNVLIKYDLINFGIKIRIIDNLMPDSFSYLVDLSSGRRSADQTRLMPYLNFYGTVYRFFPERSDALNLLAFCYYYFGEIGQAKASYQKALEILKRKISPELEKIKALQEKFSRRDLAHLEEYYSSLGMELEKKEKRCPAEEEVLKRIQDRKTALALDRQKKMSDIQEKYRLDIKAAPVNLLILYQPWVRMVWGVKTHQEELERIFYWDPVLKGFFNASCEECLKYCETYFVQNRKLICRTCREKV